MKEHNFFRHRGGQILVWSKSWTTQFGCFKYSSKRQNDFFIRKRTSGEIRKIGNCLAKPRKKVNVAGQDFTKQNTLKETEFNEKDTFLSCSSDIVSSNGKLVNPLKTKKKSPIACKRVDSINGLNNLVCRYIDTVPSKKITRRTQNLKDETDHSLVTYKRLQKTFVLSVKQRCFGGLWLMKICSLLSIGRVPLFMMHRKLPLFGGLQSKKLSARKRSFKLLDFNRLWFQKGFWNCCRKTLRNRLRKVFSYLKSKLQRHIKAVRRPYDMNNNTSGILCEIQPCTTKSCLKDETVKLQSVEAQLASSRCLLKDSHPPPLCTAPPQRCAGETIHKKISDVPVINNYPEDAYVLNEKEISISSQEVTGSHGEEGGASMLLAPDKLQACVSENVGYQDNDALETTENGEDTFLMEVDENTNSDLFSTELLDHPYCKSPMQKNTLPEEGLDESVHQGLMNGQKVNGIVTDEQLASCICGILNEFMKKYGSLIPLSEKDILTRLKEVFSVDCSNRISFISKETAKYRAKHSKTRVCNFRVLYNKHMLDMDDLTTLEGHNWLNDQVINMYGELIMDAVPDKVHYFNSFFHKQLMTKGYNGVKRWTKKVDLFKKSLLLIPLHLEVHWSLITVDIPNKIISIYDSQAIHFKFCVENIRKYLITEAKEKNQEEFLQGWQTVITKGIPQQKNDSDCGVFMLQYCKCLALEKPFLFSQEDMPRMRKKTYKELCECRLMD